MPQAAPALAVIGKAVAIASVAYSYASASTQRRKAREAAEQAQGISTMLKDAAAPWVYHYGERRVSGPIVFAQESGEDRKYLNLVIVLAPHEIFEFKWLWFDDEIVNFDGTGKVTSTNYKDRAWVYFRTGAPGQTAFSELITECPTKWTSDHRLDGCACVYVKMQWDQAVYHGGIPNISATIRGKKLFDPRNSTTYWCANPALIAYDLLTDTKIGAGIPSASVDTASVIEAANKCDEQLAYTPPAPTDNTPFRYSCHYCADSGVNLSDHLDTVVNTMAGAVVRSSGKWFIRAGMYRTPTVTITESDILGAINVSPRRSKTDLCNRVRGKYLNIPNGYVATDFPSYTNATYLSQDNGEALWADIDLPATVDPVQAQRLAKIHLERTRQQISVTLPLGLKGLQIMPTDTVMLTLARYGWTNKVFEVVGWRLAFDTGDSDNPMACQVQLQETASTVYDWSTEETVADAAPDTDLPNPFSIPAPTGVTADAGGHLNDDGTWVPVVNVSWDTPANGYVLSGGFVLIRYRVSGDTEWTMRPAIIGTALFATLTGLAVGATYNVEAAFENSFGVESAWTAADDVTVVGDTVAPDIDAPTYSVITGTTDPLPPMKQVGGAVYQWGLWITHTGTMEPDFDHWEVCVTVGSKPSVTPNTYPPATVFWAENPARFPAYCSASQISGVGVSSPLCVWARARDYTGNYSGWKDVKTYSTLGGLGGLLNDLTRVGGDLTLQDASDTTLTGVKTGNGSAVRQVLARMPFEFTNITFTAAGGGSNLAYSDQDISNRGFTAAPNGSVVHLNSTGTAFSGWWVVYIPSGSNSGSARFALAAPTALTLGATYTATISGELIQWN